MTHDEWKKRREQNIRETAVQISKEIHLQNAESVNENIEKEENVKTVFPEELIEDADIITQYIKNREKVYKDNGEKQ